MCGAHVLRLFAQRDTSILVPWGKGSESVCRGKEKLIILVVYSSLKPHDNEQIPTTTTSPRLPPKGGSLARVRGRDGVGWTLPLSAEVPYLPRR